MYFTPPSQVLRLEESTQPMAPEPAVDWSDLNQEPLPDSVEPHSAWLNTCYICAIDLGHFKEEDIDRRLYEYSPNKNAKIRNYVLSYCPSCSDRWLPTR